MAEQRLGKARLARLIGGLGVAVLSVAGCVGMPNGGPPNQYSVDQNDTGQGQAFIGPYPSAPIPNASPVQIVQGFLFASASYYTAGSVAKEFLTPAAQNWKPTSVTVFTKWDASDPTEMPAAHNKAQSIVQIHGQVQARLNGAGQPYVSAAQSNAPNAQPSQDGGSCMPGTGSTGCYQFTLVKVDGQWRIDSPPPYLLVEENAFQRGWASQDLYFFDATRQVLVPDSVFVPIGTSESDLLNKLAQALVKGPSQASWLSGATGSNVFPPNVSITVQPNPPAAAVVYLKGTLTSAEQKALPLMAAELAWTLTAPSSAGQSQIQSVALQVNSTQWPNANQQLTRTTYEKYDPYPSKAAAFTYIDPHGVPQSRCGSITNATVGQAIPVFGQAGDTALAQCTASPSAAAAPSSPAPSQSATSAAPGKHGQPGKPATYAMAAVSPDGKFVAVVSAAHDKLSIGAVGARSSLRQVLGPQQGISSISWDRRDNLWFTEAGNVAVVPAYGGKAYPIVGLPNVTALSVAPDGVRVALLLQQNASGNDSDLELAAIISGGDQGQQQVPGQRSSGLYLGSPVPLGPGIIGSALTWYDADNLIVLAPPTDNSVAGDLEKVPVNGRGGASLTPPQTASDQMVESIAAANSANMLVVGLSGGQLEVSVGSEGPWQTVSSGGSAPSYWINPAS
ncbi:MAG TPA: GerMN domain-containing protein [Streptosporangiaceae bacterium]|nr:GerMN domain-containing protein [Streptosporangiaceae bacterium]